MALSILNNIPSLEAENQLNLTNANLSNTLFQLSSGSRINSGADDAAGLAIRDGLTANITALTQSAQNATDGVGKLQVADGALAQVTDLLNRAVTLATEASTGTVSPAQAGALDAEYTSIKAEIDSIGGSTTFNGQTVFQNTSGTNSNEVQGTANLTANSVLAAGNTLTLGSGSASQTFSTTDASAASTTAGSLTNATTLTDTKTVTLSDGTVGHNFTYTNSTSTVGSLIDAVNASGHFTASLSGGNIVFKSVNGAALTAGGTDATINTVAGTFGAEGISVGTLENNVNADTVVGAKAAVVGGKLTISDPQNRGDITAALTNPDAVIGTLASPTQSVANSTNIFLSDSTSVGASTISVTIGALNSGNINYGSSTVALNGGSDNLTTNANAQAELTKLNQAIANVAGIRGDLGGTVNRLTAAGNVINVETQNLTSAEDNISAADIGTEVANLTKYQILSQTGIAALAQANQQQQNVLSLLKA